MALENGCPCAKKHIGNPSKTRKHPTWPSWAEFLDSQIIIEIKSQQDWKRLTAQSLLIRLGEQSYCNQSQPRRYQLKPDSIAERPIQIQHTRTTFDHDEIPRNSVFTISLEDDWNACYRIRQSLLQNIVNGHAKNDVYIIHSKHSNGK